jgi:hypothetical protein
VNWSGCRGPARVESKTSNRKKKKKDERETYGTFRDCQERDEEKEKEEKKRGGDGNRREVGDLYRRSKCSRVSLELETFCGPQNIAESVHSGRFPLLGQGIQRLGVTIAEIQRG